MYSLKSFAYIFTLSALVYMCNAQDACIAKETCSDCIKQLDCVWCRKSVQGEVPLIRCRNKSQMADKDWCPDGEVVDVKSEEILEENNDIKEGDRDGVGSVQLKPQKVKLRLRVGEEHELKFTYAQAVDYPVDLYYIMDLSASMKPHKVKLSDLGNRLADAMKNITRNFRLGFGSFVDKVAMPFVSTVPKKLEKPCEGCTRPYSFKNHLPLTSDTGRFTVEVENAPLSGNLDFPEGGFDALMQAMVCTEEIGWRPNARHVIVFSTDASFHIAGDGKLAGVIEPNDAQCHMSNGEYTDYLKYDYPSISHLDWVAQEKNMILIFAVVNKQKDIYKALTQEISNSFSGVLDVKSDNVISLVTGIYKSLTNVITMKDNSGSDVEIRYSSDCTAFKPPGSCGDIRVGVRTDFVATVKPLTCPPKGSAPQTIRIKPEGVNEQLLVELEVVCDCECENLGQPGYVKDAPECNSGNGDLECGICKCHDGYQGNRCECDKSVVSLAASTNDTSLCRLTPQSDECSGQGSCRCGRCECNKRDQKGELIYGKFCECNNYSCQFGDNGLICSGSDRGTCECGVCVCKSGWEGADCKCPTSNVGCIDPNSSDQIECSGRGKCECGTCKCSAGDGNKLSYSGKYCDVCQSCPSQKCDEFKRCVECQAYKSGPYDENECKLQCTAFETMLVTNITEDNTQDASDGRKICEVPISSGCTMIFEYYYFEEDDRHKLVVNAQKEKLCGKEINLIAVVGGVIASIVAAGLIALIIWKVVTTIHDRKEYEKFEQERKNPKWGKTDNPLYTNPTTTVTNPVFQRLFSVRSNH